MEFTFSVTSIFSSDSIISVTHTLPCTCSKDLLSFSDWIRLSSYSWTYCREHVWKALQGLWWMRHVYSFWSMEIVVSHWWGTYHNKHVQFFYIFTNFRLIGHSSKLENYICICFIHYYLIWFQHSGKADWIITLSGCASWLYFFFSKQ